jgi:hypothetical protein
LRVCPLRLYLGELRIAEAFAHIDSVSTQGPLQT